MHLIFVQGSYACSQLTPLHAAIPPNRGKASCAPTAAVRFRLYFKCIVRRLTRIMDKFWSIFAMPIGVALVMLPAAITWYLVDRKKPAPDHDKQPKQD